MNTHPFKLSSWLAIILAVTSPLHAERWTSTGESQEYTASGNTIKIKTKTSEFDYQAKGYVRDISPGSHFYLPMDIELISGGVGVELLNQDNQWVMGSQRQYGAHDVGQLSFALDLTIPSGVSTVQPVIYNYFPSGGVSEFIIHNAENGEPKKTTGQKIGKTIDKAAKDTGKQVERFGKHLGKLEF